MNLKNLLDKKYRLLFLIILLAELLSYSGFLWPQVNAVVFCLLSGFALYLAFEKPDWLLLIIAVELIIGSKGYLFFLDLGGASLSIRIALWLIVMATWTAKFFLKWLKDKKYPDLVLPFGRYWAGLIIFIIIGALIGLKNNSLDNVFFDLNNWFYLALLLPLTEAWPRLKDKLATVATVAVVWLVAKTLFLLYFFSHNILLANQEVYRWLAQAGLAEVTEMAGGFTRIFFQSHIFVLALTLGAFVWLVSAVKKGERVNELWLIFTLSLSVVFLSLSRSLWLGLMAGGLTALVWQIKNKLPWRALVKSLGLTLLSGIGALVILTAIVKFPYPTPGQGTAWGALSERQNITDEAAASSRWQLLPELWQQIKQAPILGAGFGKTVIYQSNDPRVRETSPDGTYETYAFEWGWLDLWLKLGLGGLIIYLLFLSALVKQAWRGQTLLNGAVAVIIVGLAAVHVFTPYLNHPLGLGIVMSISLWLNNKN